MKLAITFTLLLSTLTAFAGDNQTPAQESVCDELQGQTPGLFGLCIAYCEAQDGPEVINEDMDLSVQLSTPNRKILSNYDKKMRSGDSRMPCVSYQTSCPLWSPEELDQIGKNGGYSLEDFVSNDGNFLYDREIASNITTFALLQKSGSSFSGRFLFSDSQNSSSYVNRTLSLTEDEFNSCKTQLINHVTNPIN